MTNSTQPDGNNLAIASLVLGILSILGMGPLTGIPAVITGAMALKNPAGKGMAIAGLIMGGISIVLVLLIVLFVLIVAVIAVMAAGSFESGDYQNAAPVEPLPYQQRA